jgi:hypothetical protein
MIADTETKTLSVTVIRDRTDALTGLTERDIREVTGPLGTLTGIGALRTNLLAWVKAQTGFAGTVDITP